MNAPKKGLKMPETMTEIVTNEKYENFGGQRINMGSNPILTAG